uniref:Cytochrome c-type protein n=1 Tax=Rhodobacter capsulatus TaxID=1061 RepID=P95587_RHOCA|nr:DorC [Rhodobacter capsulatus]
MRRPSTRWGLGTLVLGGAFVGALGWNGFHYAVEQTTTTKFCLSCHSMQGQLRRIQDQPSNYVNPMGVRAECADCHVPKSGWRAFTGPSAGRRRSVGEITGKVDTPDKIRGAPARNGRNRLGRHEGEDSVGCRSCHSNTMSMDLRPSNQPDAAMQMHQAMKDGGTCIDCHKGIRAPICLDMSSGLQEALRGICRPKPGSCGRRRATRSIRCRRVRALSGRTERRREGGGQGDRGDADGGRGGLGQCAAGQAGRLAAGRRRADALCRAGRRIFNVALAPTAVAAVVPGTRIDRSRQPDTDQVWTDGTLTVWVKNADLTDSLDKVWSYAGSMFSAACGTCHVLPHTSHFLANHWIGTLNAMKPKAPLNEEQFRLVQKYVQMHAKDMGGESR